MGALVAGGEEVLVGIALAWLWEASFLTLLLLISSILIRPI